MLALADKHPNPASCKTSITGYWKADRFLYGYFDTSLFTRSRVPDAIGFEGSSKVHMSVGLCEDEEKALRDGPLDVRNTFCACAACRDLKFDQCLMKEFFGDRMRAVSVPRASGGVMQSQSATLADFAASLQADQLVAFRVAADEGTIEGPVWFAVLNGPAELLENDVLYAGQTFGAGWHVVKGHWFQYEGRVGTGGDRCYVQLEDEAVFNVNSMIRVTGVQFTSPFKRPRRRGAPTAATSRRKWVMNADVYQRVLELA